MATTGSSTRPPAGEPPAEDTFVASAADAESVDVALLGDDRRLKRHALGLFGVLFIALAGAAPMSAMLGNVPYAVGFGNGTAAPGGFILAAIVLLLFSVGYVAMARLFTTAGGFYGFISHGLGRPLGMAAGWGGMAAYSLFEAGEWGIFAYYTRSTFSQFLHINLAWPVYAFAGLALVAVLTYFDVKLSAKVLGVALVLEVLLLLVMDIVILAKGGASGISFAPLNPVSSMVGAGIKAAAPGVGIFFALWSWVGFEATANYAEEAREPRKMVPRATYIAVISLGVIYTLTAWAGVLGHGLDKASTSAATDPGTFYFSITSRFVGSGAKDVMQWLIITSTFACAMAFHAAATRYFYAMGREGILPRWLGRTQKRWQSPYAGSFFQSGIAAVLVCLFILLWYVNTPTRNFADFQTMPFLELYGWFAILGTFLVLVIMTFSGIATISYFGMSEHRQTEHWFKWLVAPLLGSIGMAYVVYLLWANLPTLGGDIFIVRAIPWVGTAWLVIGVAIALWYRSRDPEKYEVLGRMVSKGL
jgi:amino acid transporter